ncbi:MAG TPA: 16S rRNA (cytosine(1402)-N(4))-methyltransferase RsmH [Vicinamibacterales bacterium]|nr:16S rRNA (cytosine(1402)-N(4))-methyltransferase RsmH [Vicinamibacterales bacterium]
MTDGLSRPHVRRARYKGTHPRAFHEKYKEHDPGRYADTVDKVLSSGKTPAGSHRPIMVNEILAALAPQPGEFAVDCTLGYGGHAARLLDAVLPGGRLLGLDADPIELPKSEARLRSGPIPPGALVVRRSNFAGLLALLAREHLPRADVLLADLGLSSMQIDDPARGFTYKREGPLDLRMNPRRGRPASALLASLDAADLTRLLERNADQPEAAALAQALIDRQRAGAIGTTTALADAVRQAVSSGQRRQDDRHVDASVRRVFQALRVEVNDEFGALDALLRQLPECLAPGGRVAILTFHSGEDRRVKQAFAAGVQSGVYSRAAGEVERPGADERRANPRSSSAKLRWAVRA